MDLSLDENGRDSKHPCSGAEGSGSLLQSGSLRLARLCRFRIKIFRPSVTSILLDFLVALVCWL